MNLEQPHPPIMDLRTEAVHDELTIAQQYKFLSTPHHLCITVYATNPDGVCL